MSEPDTQEMDRMCKYPYYKIIRQSLNVSDKTDALEPD